MFREIAIWMDCLTSHVCGFGGIMIMSQRCQHEMTVLSCSCALRWQLANQQNFSAGSHPNKVHDTLVNLYYEVTQTCQKRTQEKEIEAPNSILHSVWREKTLYIKVRKGIQKKQTISNYSILSPSPQQNQSSNIDMCFVSIWNGKGSGRDMCATLWKALLSLKNSIRFFLNCWLLMAPVAVDNTLRYESLGQRVSLCSESQSQLWYQAQVWVWTWQLVGCVERLCHFILPHPATSCHQYPGLWSMSCKPSKKG